MTVRKGLTKSSTVACFANYLSDYCSTSILSFNYRTLKENYMEVHLKLTWTCQNKALQPGK